jgi:hypothetical protein
MITLQRVISVVNFIVYLSSRVLFLLLLLLLLSLLFLLRHLAQFTSTIVSAAVIDYIDTLQWIQVVFDSIVRAYYASLIYPSLIYIYKPYDIYHQIFICI